MRQGALIALGCVLASIAAGYGIALMTRDAKVESEGLTTAPLKRPAPMAAATQADDSTSVKLRVLVIDEDHQRVRGVPVSLERRDSEGSWHELRVRSTDDRGELSFAALSTGIWRLIVRREDSLHGLLPPIRQFEPSPFRVSTPGFFATELTIDETTPPSVERELMLHRSCAADVLILDSNGRPMEGVPVRLHRIADGKPALDYGLSSDSWGRARFSELPSGAYRASCNLAPCDLRFLGYRTPEPSLFQLSPAGSQLAVLVATTPDAAGESEIKGRLIDRNGHPVAGAELLCHLRSRPVEEGDAASPHLASVRSDGEGRFVLRGLPPDRRVCIQAVPRGRVGSHHIVRRWPEPRVVLTPSPHSAPRDLGDIALDIWPVRSFRCTVAAAWPPGLADRRLASIEFHLLPNPPSASDLQTRRFRTPAARALENTTTSRGLQRVTRLEPRSLSFHCEIPGWLDHPVVIVNVPKLSRALVVDARASAPSDVRISLP